MKVLWIEDHEPVRDMLAIAADKAGWEIKRWRAATDMLPYCATATR